MFMIHVFVFLKKLGSVPPKPHTRSFHPPPTSRKLKPHPQISDYTSKFYVNLCVYLCCGYQHPSLEHCEFNCCGWIKGIQI